MTRATSRHQKLIDNVETLVNKWESIEPRRSNISRVTPLVTNLREETGIHIFGSIVSREAPPVTNLRKETGIHNCRKKYGEIVCLSTYRKIIIIEMLCSRPIWKSVLYDVAFCRRLVVISTEQSMRCFRDVLQISNDIKTDLKLEKIRLRKTKTLPGMDLLA
ncbi:hypothetical protein L3Y34_013737 [Caenorhabditis briggsae]|uniref:Uncharacterized protein n=1 Tax=Caenorhabditis briggsae TaxID=6238 RepID=A0AAE8ZV20_CAEBR|nr:hypothetical protein L3Y34_013737 [Caenorhabditis briggsae]